ncbi:hypothetical protein [Silicimonas algicola]|uniref:Uncharacterized protein n=1 Tax=Silicimonas algicola TaxID=1826607 RepID=A0A316FWF8_9RHOB|nr:hypothetical protein [Silicimonas algicola]PWK53144.1 hypothetical protein C8D95_11446 [Silicimonas algicola]
MTSDEIAARNRANAGRSTGPRTAPGKAMVASNALRHGATARPDPGSVAGWLAIILDSPHITPGDLLPADECGVRALALAQAEAHLVAAERALQAFETGAAKPGECTKDLRETADLIMDELLEFVGTRREVRPDLSILRRIARVETEETMSGGERHRLLRRYLREARTGRRHAFEAWAAGRADNADAASLAPRRPDFPKQSQIST